MAFGLNPIWLLEWVFKLIHADGQPPDLLRFATNMHIFLKFQSTNSLKNSPATACFFNCSNRYASNYLNQRCKISNEVAVHSANPSAAPCQASLKDTELINQVKKIRSLPDEKKSVVLQFITAYIRDFDTQKAYAL
jgi:hypothetical protein